MPFLYKNLIKSTEEKIHRRFIALLSGKGKLQGNNFAEKGAPHVPIAEPPILESRAGPVRQPGNDFLHFSAFSPHIAPHYGYP
jgi:hypothetical protein